MQTATGAAADSAAGYGAHHHQAAAAAAAASVPMDLHMPQPFSYYRYSLMDELNFIKFGGVAVQEQTIRS